MIHVTLWVASSDGGGWGRGEWVTESRLDFKINPRDVVNFWVSPLFPPSLSLSLSLLFFLSKEGCVRIQG